MFKIVQINAENLFVFLDDLTPRDWRALSEKEWQKLTRATVANKPLKKVLWLAESLLHIDADLICVNEVGGEESLSNFAKVFLADKYVPHIIEGNSNRGIDVGYLLRRGSPLRAEIRNHKNRPIDFLYPHDVQTNLFNQASGGKQLKSHFFSRDCSELRLYQEGEGRPGLVVLLVHLKSKLDPDGIDPQGKERRRAELNTLVRIYSEVRAEFNPAVPVLVAGDFNGCARADMRGEEFAALDNTDLESTVEIAGLSGDEVATQLQFQRGAQVVGLQIDFIFVSPELKPKIKPASVHVYRYHSDRVPLPLPRTLDQRLALPSDHFPVVVTFADLFK